MARHAPRGRHRWWAARLGARPALLRSATLLVGAAAAGALGLSPGATASAPRAPVPSVRLPAGAEALSPYLPQVSCDPRAKPGVVAFARLMLATYHRGSDGGIVRACSKGTPSEHKEGRAWDWMLDVRAPRDKAVAYAALHWLIKPGPHGEPAWNARRFGIMYVIWDGRIWAAYRATEGWRAYHGASEHTDHIHISFSWNGAEKHTSWWTGRVAPVDYGPCPAVPGRLAARWSRPNPRPCSMPPSPPGVYARPGDHGARVVAVQRVLNVRPHSGFYGPVTAGKVRVFQARHHLAATGVVNLPTAVALHLVAPAPPPVYARPGDRGARVVAVQRVLNVRPHSGFYGAVTARKVRVFQARHHLAVTGVVDRATAMALRLVAPPRAEPVPPYAKPGDHGARVVAVQRALGVRPRSGFYGPRTAGAVRTFQRRHHLAASGVVDVRTASALRLR